MKKLMQAISTTVCVMVLTGTIAWGATGCFYRVPTPGAVPHGISYDSINNFIWFTESAQNKIGYVNVSVPPCTPTRITEFALPAGFTRPVDIAVDLSSPSASQVWFSTDSGQIGMLDRTANVYLIYPIPGNPRLDQIRVYLINNVLWFAEGSTSIIGSIPLGGGLPVTEYIFPASVPDIAGITTDFNGDVWFTSRTTGQIGKFVGGLATLWPTTLPSLETVTADPINPVIWATTGLGAPGFTEQIVKLDSMAGNVAIYTTTSLGSHPYGIRVRAGDGFITVGEEGSSMIGFIDPTISTCRSLVPTAPQQVDTQPRLSDLRFQFPAVSITSPVTPTPYNANPIPCNDPVPSLFDYPVTPVTPGPRLVDLDPSDTPWFGVPALNAIGYLMLP